MGIGERGEERENENSDTALALEVPVGSEGDRQGDRPEQSVVGTGGQQGEGQPGHRCSPPLARLARGHFSLPGLWSPPAPGLTHSLKAGPQQTCSSCFFTTFLSLPMPPLLDRMAPSSREAAGPWLHVTFGFLKPKPPMSPSSRDNDLRFTVCTLQSSFSVSVCPSLNKCRFDHLA